MASQIEPPFRSEFLREEMRRQFVTIEELAVKAGVTVRSIDRWRKGESYPRMKNVRSLAQALGREPGEFYEDQVAA